MSTYIENYGFTKTFISDNNKNINNETEWIGNYDGNLANLNINMNTNGNKESISLQLDNNDLMELLSVQPVEKPLDQRLRDDFLIAQSLDKKYNPITLEGAFKKKKTRHRKRRSSNRRQKNKIYTHKYYKR